MFQIAVNTSLSHGHLALLKDQQVLSEKSWERAGSHSEILTPTFKGLLAENSLKPKDIGHIYCVIGPGSFTGIRVGLNFAKSMAYACDINVTPVNSLLLLATNCQNNDRPIFSCIDAQKNSVFLSKFKDRAEDLEVLFENEVVSISDLKKKITQKSYLCGKGLDKYLRYIPQEVSSLVDQNKEWDQPNFANFFKKKKLLESLPKKKWFELQPLYIKASSPEELLKAKTQG